MRPTPPANRRLDPLLTTAHWSIQDNPSADVSFPWRSQIDADADMNIRRDAGIHDKQQCIFGERLDREKTAEKRSVVVQGGGERLLAELEQWFQP